MNAREDWLKTLLFDSPERIPLQPGGGRESTRARWHQEGLPSDIEDGHSITVEAYRQGGGTLELPRCEPGFWVNERMIPQFEEKIIERKERSLIVQDWKGNVCEISDEFDVRHLREAIDFVTRRWVKCPVENWRDWEDMKNRYDADDPNRLPDNVDELAETLKERTWPVVLHFSGPFWQMREWLGFEQLCMMFHDDPTLIRAMVEFWQEHVTGLIHNALKHVTPDMIHVSEDMAYKCFSMISPEMVREFLLPCYKHWGGLVEKYEVPLYGVDSDGFIGELIPIWIEAGMNCCDPIEVAAGNDIVAFRKEFGKEMAYRGGVDKRAMAAGGKTLTDEIDRIRPVIESGGYIPGCDHGVPADVSWPNFVDYTRLLAEATGWN